MDIISTDLGLIMSIFVATHFLKVHQKIAKLMLKMQYWHGMASLTNLLSMSVSSSVRGTRFSSWNGSLSCFLWSCWCIEIRIFLLLFTLKAKIFIIISCRPDCRTPQSFHRLQTCKTYSAQHHCWTTCVINLPEVYLTLSSRFSSGPSPIYPCHSLTNCCLVDLFDVMRKRE